MPDTRFLVSVDTTNFNRADEIKQKLPEVEIHTYDKSSVAEVYKNVPVDTYRYTLEPFNLAAKSAIDRFGTSFDYIWLVEDDVVICGGITNLMALHASSTADFISAEPGLKPDWEHFNDGNDNFLARYPADKRSYGPENVIRFSKDLLDRLHKLAYEESVSAYSEMLAYTIVQNENYKFEKCQPKLLGKYCWNCMISKEEATEMCAKVEQEGKVTINHAGKF